MLAALTRTIRWRRAAIVDLGKLRIDQPATVCV
jgi:hypothetical protein